MSASLVALNLNGMEALFSGESRCWRVLALTGSSGDGM